MDDLGATRDWGSAPDYVDAMVRVLHCDQPDDYIVSTGEAHSVAEFAELAFRAAGLGDASAYLRSDPGLLRTGDAAVQVGDASRLRHRLGWSPTKTFPEVVDAMVAADLERL